MAAKTLRKNQRPRFAAVLPAPPDEDVYFWPCAVANNERPSAYHCRNGNVAQRGLLVLGARMNLAHRLRHAVARVCPVCDITAANMCPI